MRNHPVVGVLFLVAAAGLFLLGAFASSAPGPLADMPVPPEVVVPFLLWQFGMWSAMFGIFFLRPRRGRGGLQQVRLANSRTATRW